MNIKEFFQRHFQSEGFQLRLRNVYLPGLKMLLSWAYRKIHGYLESRYFGEIYRKQDSALEDEDEIVSSVSPSTERNSLHSLTALSFEEAVELLKPYLLDHEPQKFGTCVAHTYKNALRLALKIVDEEVDVDFSEGDIYIDRETLHLGIDSGMYPSRTLDRIAKKGIAIAGIVPEIEKKEDLSEMTRELYPDEYLEPFRVRGIIGGKLIAGRGDFEAIWGYITDTYISRESIRPFQASIDSYSDWWGTDLPTATGAILGGHSIVAITIPFELKGERAFFVLDSAYRTGGVWRVGKGIRIVRESVWKKLGKSARSIEFVSQIERELDVLDVWEQGLITETAEKNSSGKHVAKIQRALIALGYDIPAITTSEHPGKIEGYYGQQTASAVQKWQVDNWELFYNKDLRWTKEELSSLQGNYFGSLSVIVINEMLARLE